VGNGKDGGLFSRSELCCGVWGGVVIVVDYPGDQMELPVSVSFGDTRWIDGRGLTIILLPFFNLSGLACAIFFLSFAGVDVDVVDNDDDSCFRMIISPTVRRRSTGISGGCSGTSGEQLCADDMDVPSLNLVDMTIDNHHRHHSPILNIVDPPLIASNRIFAREKAKKMSERKNHQVAEKAEKLVHAPYFDPVTMDFSLYEPRNHVTFHHDRLIEQVVFENR
jgi:hypothetical protein